MQSTPSNKKDNQPVIFHGESTIHKKLGNLKFDQIFDSGKISGAERVLKQNEMVFSAATKDDFAELKKVFEEITDEKIDSETYNKIFALSFSIKSRAATGGLEIASQIANSLYKFCEKATTSLPKDGYTILRLHFSALNDVFSNKFPVHDTHKCNKLVSGLEAVANKYINSDT